MPPMNFAKELAQMKAENGGLYEHLSGLSKAELMDRASALVRHTSVETAIQPGPRMSLLPPSCLDSLGHSHIDEWINFSAGD